MLMSKNFDLIAALSGEPARTEDGEWECVSYHFYGGGIMSVVLKNRLDDRKEREYNFDGTNVKRLKGRDLVMSPKSVFINVFEFDDKIFATKYQSKKEAEDAMLPVCSHTKYLLVAHEVQS